MRSTADVQAYQQAQRAIADLKAAIALLLADAPAEGLKNVEIGHALGIYAGHKGHVGHIPRTLLSWMEAEGMVRQNVSTKRWVLSEGVAEENDEPDIDA